MSQQLSMIWKKNLWRWVAVLYVLIVFYIGISGQIEEISPLDTLKVDSISQNLKMILEKGDTTLLIPVDSLAFIPLKQKIDSIRDPKRAWWYSAILPGLGQAYNKKCWKIPIIYTTLLGAYFIIDDNNTKYNYYKKAYIDYAKDKTLPSWVPKNYTESRLKDKKDFFKRNRDLSIILGVMIYFMNILDASVDANLMNFDIGDDLSMSVRPNMDQLVVSPQNMFGLKFVITLNK